jgi:hypothetical protein
VFMTGHSNYSRFAQDWFTRRKVTGAWLYTSGFNSCRLFCGHYVLYSVLHVKLILLRNFINSC